MIVGDTCIWAPVHSLALARTHAHACARARAPHHKILFSWKLAVSNSEVSIYFSPAGIGQRRVLTLLGVFPLQSCHISFVEVLARAGCDCQKFGFSRKETFSLLEHCPGVFQRLVTWECVKPFGFQGGDGGSKGGGRSGRTFF